MNAAYNADQYAGGTESRVQRACAGAEGPALLKCVAEEVAASREDQRTEYDLQAQQESAKAAFWMVVVGAITMVMTAAALWFVKRTLDATYDVVTEAGKATQAARDAVGETKRIGEAQVRAYLTITDAQFRLRHGCNLEFRFTVVNSGQSPARGLTPGYAAQFPSRESDFIDTPPEYDAAQGDVPTKTKHITVPHIWAGGIPDALVTKGEAFVLVSLVAHIKWKDVFDIVFEQRENFTLLFKSERMPDDDWVSLEPARNTSAILLGEMVRRQRTG